MRKLLLGFAALLMLGARPAGAIDVVADFVSEYVFRGASFRQGASIQAALGYNVVGNLNASLWTNLRLEGGVALSETDYAVEWGFLTTPLLGATVGGVYYDRSATLIGPETAEVFGGVEFDVPARPALYLFYDFDSRPGAYIDISGGHSFLLPDYRGTIDLGGSLGFDLGRIDGFNDARVSVSFSRHLGDWRIAPGLDLHFPANRVDPAADGFRPVFRFTAARSF